MFVSNMFPSYLLQQQEQQQLMLRTGAVAVAGGYNSMLDATILQRQQQLELELLQLRELQLAQNTMPTHSAAQIYAAPAEQQDARLQVMQMLMQQEQALKRQYSLMQHEQSRLSHANAAATLLTVRNNASIDEQGPPPAKMRRLISEDFANKHSEQGEGIAPVVPTTAGVGANPISRAAEELHSRGKSNKCKKKAQKPVQEDKLDNGARLANKKAVKANLDKDKQPKKKDVKWLESYEELQAYKAEHGDCIVPRGYSLNPRLASWVAEQRKQYKLLQDSKQSSITDKRIKLLNALDFAWNAQEAAWIRHLEDLKTYKLESGHCHVPLNHEKYPKLGLWVKEQRRHYTLLRQGKQSHMTDERVVQLNAVGLCWDTHEATWLERLRELALFKDKYGSCAVPATYSANTRLSTWVHHQRRQYKKFKEGKPCHITQDRVDALDALDFVWYPRDKGSDWSFTSSSPERDVDTEYESD